MLYFKFTTPCVMFLRVGRKSTNFWKFFEKFRKFSKNLLGKLRKRIFSIVFKKSYKPFVKFLLVLDETRKLLGNFLKFLMKILLKNWIFILENCLLNIEPSEIAAFFYNNVFGFGGKARNFPLSPLATPLVRT